MSEIKDLLKKRTLALGAFTRQYNSLDASLSKNPSKESITRAINQLETCYNSLEARSDELTLALEEDDDKLDDITNALREKCDLLNDIRCKALSSADPAIAAVSDQSEMLKAISSANQNTADMVKAFQASLTVPKPNAVKFNGDVVHYANFVSYLETHIEPSVTDGRQRLSLVINSCTGIAYDAVCYLSQMKDGDEAYQKAKDILKDLFGRKHQVARAVLDECTRGPIIKGQDLVALRKLAISLQKAETTLKESGSEEVLTSTESLVKIFKRLPKHLQNIWSDKVYELEEKDKKPSFSDLRTMLQRYVKSRDNEYNAAENPQKSSSKPVFAVNESSSSSSSSGKKVVCILCKDEHYLNQCNKFLKMSVEERGELVLKEKLCKNCLHVGHIALKCKRKSLCKKCDTKHNILLHDSNDDKSDESKNSVSGQAQDSLNAYKLSGDKTSAGITCVEVLVEGKDAMYKCKAIVDSKSSCNLCTKKLANKLNLSSETFKTRLNVATGTSVVQGSKIIQAKVYSRDMSDFVIARDVLALDSIPLSMNSVFSYDDISGFDHLKDVVVAECTSADEIDLLIGSGVPKAFHQYEQRRGGDSDIYAVRQTLGWELVGPRKVSESINSSALISENVFFTDVLGQKSMSHELGAVFNGDFKDCSLFSEALGPSSSDLEAIDMVKRSMVLRDGQFCVGLPWKHNPANLPSCREIVMKRLLWLKSRFLKDFKLRKSYQEEMKMLIENNYLERSANFSADTDFRHYIPHHPVWHPKKGKLRIVWDCALSLNNFLHEGPDLLNSIVEVLIRFRRFKYAVCSDIRKMYLSVKVPPGDRGALRVLWWPEGDIDKEPVEYRATVHIFGAKSSGFIANHCVRSLAERAEDPLVKNAILQDFYVDDQLSSVQQKDDAIRIIHGTSKILSEGGFHLTKFVSNCDSILESVPDDDKGNSTDLLLGESKAEHSTLGLHWKVSSDQLGFPCSIPNAEQNPTRRLLLSAVAKVYDPLGVVAPAVLPLKILIQNKLHLGWDETDDDMICQWKELCEIIQRVSNFTIPRCYKPSTSGFDDPSHISIHGFSDASKEGYAAVVYLRQVSSDGQVCVSFVYGKSRVAPKFKGHIPQATIPKLELNAAALLTKMISKVKGCIDIDIQEVVYWCDSQAVLSCIHSPTGRFPVYWSNRLAVIHGHTEMSEWRYVPTDLNPADVGSRGVSSKQFSSKMKFWTDGPSFLLKDSVEWPASQTVHPVEEAVMTTVEVNLNLLDQAIEFYSNLPRLLRLIARILRFMERKNNPVKNAIDADDMHKAEIALIRYDQKSITVSHMKKLKPFKDTDGLLRVCSRLSNAKHLLYDVRFPIILRKGSHITNLIIQREHLHSAHQSPKHILTQLRQRFWIVNGLKAVKSVTSRCRKCKEENARPLDQQMSPLPEERLKPSFPFQSVGIDYFGPFMCKVRRQRFKRYGCIFVCLTTRAVHLECVNSLESSSFLCAFSRFISRRGVPETVFSDNATNFRGAQEELKDVVVSLDKVASEYSTSKGIKWHFHPPHGSHHGGHYERLIRSVRRVLRGLTNEQILSEDNLTTFLCETEKILNDRPLTSITDDPGDEMPLTPNLILLLRGNSCQSLHGECMNEPKRFHRQAQFLADMFWKRWLKEYLTGLRERQKWLIPKPNLKIGDVVLLPDEGCSRGNWPLGLVIDTYPNSDGLVRKVQIKTKNGSKVRPITKLVLLEAS